MLRCHDRHCHEDEDYLAGLEILIRLLQAEVAGDMDMALASLDKEFPT